MVEGGQWGKKGDDGEICIIDRSLSIHPYRLPINHLSISFDNGADLAKYCVNGLVCMTLTLCLDDPWRFFGVCLFTTRRT